MSGVRRPRDDNLDTAVHVARSTMECRNRMSGTRIESQLLCPQALASLCTDRPTIVVLKWQRSGEVTQQNWIFACALEKGTGVELRRPEWSLGNQ